MCVAYEFVTSIREYEGNELVDVTMVKFITKKEIIPWEFLRTYENKFHSLPIPQSGSKRGFYAHVLDEIADEHKGTWERIEPETVACMYLCGDELTPKEMAFMEKMEHVHPEVYWMGVFLKGGMDAVNALAHELGTPWEMDWEKI